jgi:hypothetical protein
MSDAAGDHVPHGPDALDARIEGENIRDAGADMPGMRGALQQGTLTRHTIDPDQTQGDEHRDPPPNAPSPTQPSDSPRVQPMRDPVKPA